jgi:hypothetical protein
MLIAADWLRRRLPVFASCSRKLIRHLCKPYWATGWTNRDIVHALDHRPGVFDQAPGVLISPAHIAAPQVFIASRLRAWRDADGVILTGHYSARLTDTAATKAARAQIAARHGRAGAALLRPGEHTLTPHRITEHGHASKLPASPATRAAAKTALAATLTKPPRLPAELTKPGSGHGERRLTPNTGRRAFADCEAPLGGWPGWRTGTPRRPGTPHPHHSDTTASDTHPRYRESGS